MPRGNLPILRSRLETLVRSRSVRICLAATLIGFGAWSFSPYVLSKVAPGAFVNAELIRITAPINGQLTQDLPHKGDLVDSSNKIKLIQSITIDRSRLVSVQQQYEVADAKANLARSQIAELAAADKILAKRTEEYRAAIQNRFDREMPEIELELKACRNEEEVRRQATMRAEQMVEQQLLSRMRLDVIKGDYFKATEACRGISGRQQKLKAESDASASGTFVQDGSGVPFSEQERSRLLLSRQGLERELLDASSNMDQLDAEILAERSHLDSLTHYDLNLPSGYMIWSVMASPGSAVVEGQTIMELADCNNPFVVVEFPERELASIKVGDVADIRLVGGNEWRKGRVRRVRGSAARSDEILFAAAVPDPKEHHIAVEIAMSEDSRLIEVNRACDIGRLAEVRLERHALELISWLTQQWDKPAKLAQENRNPTADAVPLLRK